VGDGCVKFNHETTRWLDGRPLDIHGALLSLHEEDYTFRNTPPVSHKALWSCASVCIARPDGKHPGGGPVGEQTMAGSERTGTARLPPAPSERSSKVHRECATDYSKRCADERFRAEA